MDALDKSISSLKAELEGVAVEERRLRSELGAIQIEPTDADLDKYVIACHKIFS